MDLAIADLQKGFLDAAQIASSRMVMGLDRQLIADRTYFVVEADGAVAGCGGWSRRATLYGGDHTPGRDAALLDPAMDAARADGFGRVELMATLSGRALYSRCGYLDIEAVEDARGGAPVPLVRMGKAI